VSIDEAFFALVAPYVASAIEQQPEREQVELRRLVALHLISVSPYVNEAGVWVRVHVGPYALADIAGEAIGLLDLLDADTSGALLAAVDAAQRTAALCVPDDLSGLDTDTRPQQP
jgi:hypothetical protein